MNECLIAKERKPRECCLEDDKRGKDRAEMG